MEAWPLRQPIADQLRFVRPVVVQNQVHIQFWRNVLLDGVAEVAKLDRAMAALRLSDQFTRLGIEGGEQAGGAMTRIIVCAAFDLPWTHG
jgi:hypothetical protein